ncbi:SHOCT domain-containing protein [Gracilibacillus salinarum]|uniref:SHOCT domain-containing protein n=1 Tax=Gracilibacillus salinarum TaxID=2932255 RepID=A0ABY4GIF7_9BACI|nr:SHOCT domain-containing protein [Gracilibacillus salinarum]UOQ83969.1 SHOCT domain-containing protein [Gracilibacillus salinarum]
MMNGMNGSVGFMGGGFIFTLFMIIVIVLIVMVSIWMFKTNNKQNYKKGNDNESLNILKQRLAKGEISEDEYDRLKNKLDR